MLPEGARDCPKRGPLRFVVVCCWWLGVALKMPTGWEDSGLECSIPRCCGLTRSIVASADWE
eukprot:1492637-Alexandrium_andersonii.AAC.1